MNEYQDIMNIPHPELKYHPRMSMENRAAQFAPFAALTGFEEEIWETKRLTESKKYLSEESLQKLNETIQLIQPNQMIKVLYFVPDLKKEGGKYLEYIGKIKRIDSIQKEMLFYDKKRISLLKIISIQILENKE